MMDQHFSVPKSRPVEIMGLEMGGAKPILIQSMINVDTLRINEGVAQSLRMAENGAQLIRFTTQGLKEVKALADIVTILEEKIPAIPIVADVHFNAKLSLEAAKICHKVRINPGNFTENKKDLDFENQDLFNEGLQKNRLAYKELVETCKTYHTALRIGVNHGSLSKRIMARYGDSPEGMVESAMEFLRMSREFDFHKLVVSLKSSNTRVMVKAYRLLLRQMLEEDLYYPLHLGVTESGDGLEGRIKSVVGIAPLLMEGIGDTIRVSLTEPPENELPVADLIRSLFPKPGQLPYHPLVGLPWNPSGFDKPVFREVEKLGGNNPPRVFSPFGNYSDPLPDYTFQDEKEKIFCLNEKGTYVPLQTSKSSVLFISPVADPVSLAKKKAKILIMEVSSEPFTAIKTWISSYIKAGGNNPLVIKKCYETSEQQEYIVKASGEYGLLLIDGLISGVWIENPSFSHDFNKWFSFYLLQASRNRTTSTEYIACPSCGRTLFDIQDILAKVRKETAHLVGLKIAVMGCIVNGPGEMADADYGYVGAGPGKVSIYKGQEVLRKNIASSEAIKTLVEEIKANGDWVDP